MTTIEYSVPAIHCGHCVKTIEREVAELAGVSAVKATEDTKRVSIQFDAPATPASIEALLEEIGYPAAR